MATFPESRLGKVEFYEARLAAWGANTEQIGLTEQQVTLITALTQDARAAYEAHVTAAAAAKAATQTFYDKVRFMHSLPGAGSSMVGEIRSFAKTTNNPNVYALALIPPPKAPAPTPAPGTPESFKVTLRPDGTLGLRWKCSNPGSGQGPVYEILRRIGNGPMVFLRAVGTKSYIDDSLPGGAEPATYQITAVRTTVRGTPAQFTVQFGVGGLSVTVASGKAEAA